MSWVHPGRVTSISTGPGGGYLLVVWSTRATFAVRDLEQIEVVRDLTPLRTLTYDDTGEVYLSLELEHLPDYVETGAPVMVEVDEHNENVMHLYPDALCQEEPILLYELQLFCPVEREGRRFQRRDGSVYECTCGAAWDVASEDEEEMDSL